MGTPGADGADTSVESDTDVAVATPRRALIVRALIGALALGLVLTAGVALRPLASDSKICPDFIQFWTAAKLIASGRSPYDVEGQAAIQREAGWRREVDGLGRYDFLPYYYPPWLGLACVGLLPLGYVGARAAWLAINLAALVASALLLRRTVRGASSPAIGTFVIFFAPSVVAALMGQVSPLLLLMVAGAWRLLDRGHDTAAGAVLGALTVKPQLTIILIAALLAWTATRRRWRVAGTFLATLAVLALVSAFVVPSSFLQMIQATRATELPTYAFPWTGATVFALLQTSGLRGAALWAGYLVVALPAIVLVARVALDRSSRLPDVMGLGLLAPFFVATYARHYDFPVLLVPVLILVSRAAPRARAALLAALLVLPYAHIALFPRIASWCNLPPFPGPQFTFFWIPLVVGLGWLAQNRGPWAAETSCERPFRVS